MNKAKGVQNASFQHRKKMFLGKEDKSSAGGIDVHAREVCAVINDRDDAFTTSSCSGRAFLWRGEGVKSTTQFSRYRVTHELIPEAEPYFDLASLADEVVDGAWEDRRRTREKAPARPLLPPAAGGLSLALGHLARRLCCRERGGGEGVAASDAAVWLRFEPFILHLCCRDFAAAAAIIAAARQVFKNVGVQSWAENKIMIALWGDEGLEMPLTDPAGRSLFRGQAAWLQEQVNSRHRRNWAKIDRFTASLRLLPPADHLPPSSGCSPSFAAAAAEPAADTADGGGDSVGEGVAAAAAGGRAGPRHFDVVGDVALLGAVPDGGDDVKAAVGEAILKENRRIRVVAARRGCLQGDLRAPGALEILAGPARRPLITTHSEFGVRYVVNLESAFFNPRMGPERQRICEQVQAGERVAVLFAGVCPEALQLTAKTAAEAVVAMELNSDAVRCARRSLELLERRDAGRAARLEIREGDVRTAAAELPRKSFHRVLAPRPKGKTEEEDAALVGEFLWCIVPLLRVGGVCHWYDFVADWEFPACERSTTRLKQACMELGRECTILRCAAANNKPVAERQYRTVIDFAVS